MKEIIFAVIQQSCDCVNKKHQKYYQYKWGKQFTNGTIKLSCGSNTPASDPFTIE